MEYLNFSRKPQYFIFFLACAISFGSHFASHVFSPLKDVIKRNLGISNTQFGLLQSSELLFQSITPFIGGAVTDRIGARKSSVIATSIILSGELLMTISVFTLPRDYQFEFLGAGQLLFGLGAGWIIAVLEIIIVQNYSQYSVAFAMGSLFAVNKLSGFLATGVSVHVVEWTNNFTSIFWLCLTITLLSWLASIAYYYTPSPEDLFPTKETGIPMSQANHGSSLCVTIPTPRVSNEFRDEIKSPLPTQPRQVRTLGPLIDLLMFEDKVWYYLLVIRVLVGATWTPFVRLLSNIIKHMYTIPEAEAAWQASIVLGLPIFFGPLFGLLQGRLQSHFTPQPYLIVFSSFVATLSFILIGSSYVSSPYPSLILFAIALSCGPLALTTMAPVLLSSNPDSRTKIGALFGLQTSISHMVGALMDTLTGHIQDKYSIASPSGFGNGYVQVLQLLQALSILELAGTILFVLIWFPPPSLARWLPSPKLGWSRLPATFHSPSFLPSHIPIRKYLYLITLLLLFLLVWCSYLVMLL